MAPLNGGARHRTFGTVPQGQVPSRRRATPGNVSNWLKGCALLPALPARPAGTAGTLGPLAKGPQPCDRPACEPRRAKPRPLSQETTFATASDGAGPLRSRRTARWPAKGRLATCAAPAVAHGTICRIKNVRRQDTSLFWRVSASPCKLISDADLENIRASEKTRSLRVRSQMGACGLCTLGALTR